ncbi:MAG: tetratricopeptide repeat protein [Thermodesulfobacteriota bacterium]
MGRAAPVFVLLLLALVGAFSLHEIANLDIGWHLKAGEYIVTERAVPTTDIFSYTASGRPYLDSHWLFQVVTYGAYSMFGVYGLNLLIVAVAAAVFITLFRLADFLKNPYAATLFFLPAILAASPRFMIRPELFTFLFVAVYLYILERHGKRETVYLLPFIQLLWVNMHGLFPLGLVMVFCYITGGLAAVKLRLPFEWNNEGEGGLSGDALRRLAIVFTVMVLVSLVNPYGAELALYPLTLFTEVSEAGSVVRTTISELMSPFAARESVSLEFMSMYWFLAVGTLLSFALNYRRVDLFSLLLCAAFFYLSALAVRNVVLFAVIAAPIAVLNVSRATSSTASVRGFLSSVPGSVLRAGFTLAVTVVAGYYFLSVVSNRYYMSVGSYMRTGPGLSEIRYPTRAVDFIRANGIKGNVFNSVSFGGYFIWSFFPEQKVFFDGRWEVYGEEFFRRYNAMVTDPAHFKAAAGSYGVNYVLLDYTAPEFFGLTGFLSKDPSWRLVYCGDAGVVFVRDAPENRTVPNRCDLDSPVSSDIGALERTYLERMEEGFFSRTVRLMGRLMRSSTGGEGDPVPHFARGILFGSLGRFQRAEEELLKSLAVFPDLQEAHYNLALVYFNTGRMDRAARELGFVLEADPEDDEAKKFLELIPKGG